MLLYELIKSSFIPRIQLFVIQVTTSLYTKQMSKKHQHLIVVKRYHRNIQKGSSSAIHQTSQEFKHLHITVQIGTKDKVNGYTTKA